MNKASERQARYDAKSVRRYGLKLNLTTDAEIIERLDGVESMQGYIKDLIRADIERDNGRIHVYSIINASVEEANEMLDAGDLEYDIVFSSESIGLILKRLDKLSDSTYCVEDHWETYDGDYVGDMEFDKPSHFREMHSAHKI